MSKYPDLKSLVLLLAVLGIPFGIRTLSPQLEIYPALLLPAGAGRAFTEEKVVEITSIELYGIDAASGKLRRLDPAKLMAPISTAYLPPLYGNTFGLEAENPKPHPIWFRKIGVIYFHPPIFTEEERRITRDWFKKKLLADGFQPEQLILRRIIRIHHQETHQIIKESVIHEQVINLT